ncbi:MAG TPA: nuclear transport factor 2 family protein, partial [Pyrinomonadaceae bacterium]
PQPTQSAGWSQAGSWQQPPPQQPMSSLAQPRKRRVWPWVVGILGVFVVGVVALLGVIGYVGYKAVREAERQATASRKAGAPPARADLQTYVNSPTSFTGTLKDHYSDFSFQYPASWVLKEQPGQSRSNFVKVERSLDGSTTLENFAVGWYTSTGTAAGDAALFPQLARQLSTQFAAGFPGYRKVSEGPARVGSYDGYEFRFTSRLRNPQGQNIDLYGRAVMLPSGSTVQRNGVALIMLATSLAPEIKSVDDVGTKGELPVILESFRMGKDGAAPPAAAPDETTSEAADSSEEIAAAEKAAGMAVRGVFGGGGEADAPADRDAVLEQLKGIEEEWARANNEGDKEAAARILAEEYVGTDHTGATERKAEYIRSMKPSAQIESQSFEDLKVVVAGGRAILTGVLEVDFKGGRTGRFRFVDTFVWRDGRWQAVTSTSSEIQ